MSSELETQSAECDSIRMLTLDGGDTRCISQLKILGEFMHRLEMDLKKPIRPCEYFNFMTGVGAGGVIVILLGVLCMSIEDATAAFAEMCVTLFPEEGSNVEKRSTKLEELSKELLIKQSFPIAAKYRDEPILSSECKVSVCYMSAINIGPCLMLRSYPSRHSSHNPSIIEAIRIAWATPGLFSSVHIGPEFMKEELVSAVNGVNNPTFEAIREANEVFGGARQVSCLLSLGAGRLSTLTADTENMLEQMAQDTEATAREVQMCLEKLGIYFRFSVEHGLQSHGLPPGVIVAHTAIYLHENPVSQKLDDCIEASKRINGIALDQLFYTPEKELELSPGLPPLSSFFIIRKEALETISNRLLGAEKSKTQRIMVISALGGSGKSQLAIKFARDHSETYDHIIFIDASSVESLKSGIVNCVKALDLRFNPASVNEALGLLAQPKGFISRNWLLIFDNADDSNIMLQKFFPKCDHGSILITTRNPMLGNLAPEHHLSLDVMSPSEAVEVLLQVVLGPKAGHSSADIRIASGIVEQLGYLPLAIVQAGCYIKMQNCLKDYPNLLQRNRARLLRHPALAQRDSLKYDHSVYAAFDVALEALSSHTLQFLSILSFLHFSHFPRLLIQLAASRQFAYQRYDLLERDSNFEDTVNLLQATLCPGGILRTEILDQILMELQQYSFVTLVTTRNIVTLRFHPLLHAWAQDRLSVEDCNRYRAAALRLVMCGTDEDESDLVEFIVPQLRPFTARVDELHINDQAAIAAVVYSSDHNTKKLVATWGSISQRVRAVHSETHIRSTKASLELANAYWMHNEWRGAEWLARRVVKLRTDTLGFDHSETLESMAYLARGLRRTGRISEAKGLYIKILQIRRPSSEEKSRGYSDILYELALCYMASEDFEVAETFLSKAASIREAILGAAHRETIRAMYALADCYDQLGYLKEAVTLREEALELQTATYGDNHVQTLSAMTYLAETYCQQGKLSHAERLYRQILRLSQETPGYSESETLDVLTCLAEVLSVQGRYKEAEPLWREVADMKEKIYGPYQEDTLYSLSWLGEVLHHQTLFTESESIWKLVVERRRAVYGNNHIETLTSIRWLAASLAKQGRHVEAEPYWREAAGTQLLMIKHKYPPLARRKLTQISYHYIRNARNTAVQIRNHSVNRAPMATINSNSVFSSRYGSAAGSVGEPLESSRRHSNLDEESHSLHSFSTHDSNNVSFRSDGHPPTKANLMKAITTAEDPLSLIEDIAKDLRNRDSSKRASFRSYGFDTHSTNNATEIIQALQKYAAPKSSDLANVRWNSIHESLVNPEASRPAKSGNREIRGPSGGLGYIPQESEERNSQLEEVPKVIQAHPTSLQQSKTAQDCVGLRDCCRYFPDSVERSIKKPSKKLNESRAKLIWKDNAGGRRKLVGDLQDNTLNDARAGLAESLSEMGKYADAEVMWRQVMKARNITLGPQHAETVYATVRLAMAIEQQSRYEEAESLWKEILDGQPDSEFRLEASCHLADLVYNRGGFEEAGKLYEKLHEESQKSQDIHVDSRHVFHRLAESLFYQQDYRAAEPLLRKLREYRQVQLGSNHVITLDCLYLLAEALYDQSVLEESRSLYQQVYNKRRVVLGDQHVDTLSALYRVSLVEFHQERYNEAEPLLRELLKRHRQISGGSSLATLDALSLLADTLHQLKRDIEATSLYQELLIGRREMLGRDHQDTLQTAVRLAQLLDKQKRYAEADQARRNAQMPPLQRPFLQRVLNSRRVSKLFVRP